MIRKLLAFSFALAFACAPSPLSAQTNNYARMLSGVNYQTSGLPYIFVPADITRVTTFNSASPVTATLAAGSTNQFFGAGSIFSVTNIGAGTVTIQCTACTINGASTLALAQNQGADIYGDGVNYAAVLGVGGGNGNVSGSTALGNQVVGLGAQFGSQTKPIIDVRDKGVDCTGSVQADTALAFLATTDSITSSQLFFPNGCQITVKNTILVKNQASFSILGASRTGAAGKGVKIKCVSGGTCTGGPVIDMEYVDGFEVAGLTIDANGLASSSLNIDKTGAGGVWNTTDGRIHDMTFGTSISGGGTQGWTGVQISAVSGANVEDMRVENSAFFCNARPGNYAQYGVVIGASSNAKNEVIRHSNFTNCLYAVWKKSGSAIIAENEFTSSGGACASGTGSDIRDDANSDVDRIEMNLDENGTQFFNCNNDAALGCGTGYPTVITGNHFAPAGCENTSNYWINIGQAGGPIDIYDNGWDADAGLNKVMGTAQSNGFSRQLRTTGNSLPNSTFTPWWTQAPLNGYTDEEGLFTGNRLFVGSMSGQAFPSSYAVWRAYLTNTSYDDFAAQTLLGQNNVSTFLLKHVQGNAGAFIALDAPLPALTVAAIPSPAFTPNIANQGAAGGTTYSYAFVPYVGSTNCVGGTHAPPSSITTTTTGNATLNSTNYNELQFLGVPGATEYGIWRTACGGVGVCSTNPTGRIACVSALQTTNFVLYSQGAAYPANQVINNNKYDLNDTGLSGDASSLPAATNNTGQTTLNGPVTIGDGSFGSSQTSTAGACETSFAATTLNVGGTTTDTGQNCLPANAVIDSVVYRITTTITTAANFTIGDGTTAARFCGTQSTLTAGTTGICFVQADQTGAAGPRQTSAAKVRVTTNVNPGAGAIRLIVYYHTWSAPTS